jgi:hypothetical protein
MAIMSTTITTPGAVMTARELSVEEARELAVRFVERRCGCGHVWETRPDGCDCISPVDSLDDYERDALIGCLGRRARAELAVIRAGHDSDHMTPFFETEDDLHGATVSVCVEVGLVDSEGYVTDAWLALVHKAAGWPS